MNKVQALEHQTQQTILSKLGEHGVENVQLSLIQKRPEHSGYFVIGDTGKRGFLYIFNANRCKASIDGNDIEFNLGKKNAPPLTFEDMEAQDTAMSLRTLVGTKTEHFVRKEKTEDVSYKVGHRLLIIEEDKVFTIKDENDLETVIAAEAGKIYTYRLLPNRLKLNQFVDINGDGLFRLVDATNIGDFEDKYNHKSHVCSYKEWLKMKNITPTVKKTTVRSVTSRELVILNSKTDETRIHKLSDSFDNLNRGLQAMQIHNVKRKLLPTEIITNLNEYGYK